MATSVAFLGSLTRAATPETSAGSPSFNPPAGPESRGRNRPPERVNRPRSRASNSPEREREAEEDRKLVVRAQAGDPAAFDALVRRHQRRAFAIAVQILRNEQDALEVVQEAFLRVHRGLKSFQGSSSFFTWLYRIVSNLSIDLIRKPVRRESEALDTRLLEADSDQPLLAKLPGSDPLRALRNREISDQIDEAIAQLPPYHRGVIVMREIQGLSYDEMAKAMGVSKGTIMSRLFHARRKLQVALADCYREQFGRDPQKV